MPSDLAAITAVWAARIVFVLPVTNASMSPGSYSCPSRFAGRDDARVVEQVEEQAASAVAADLALRLRVAHHHDGVALNRRGVRGADARAEDLLDVGVRDLLVREVAVDGAQARRWCAASRSSAPRRRAGAAKRPLPSVTPLRRKRRRDALMVLSLRPRRPQAADSVSQPGSERTATTSAATRREPCGRPRPPFIAFPEPRSDRCPRRLAPLRLRSSALCDCLFPMIDMGSSVNPLQVAPKLPG